MNNELKEILDRLDYVDTKEHLLDLFNYITNLQQEIEKLNDDKRGMLVQLYKANDERDKLQQENEELKKKLDRRYYKNEYERIKKENERLQENNQAMQEEMARTWQKCNDYKTRCEKAIEKINYYKCFISLIESEKYMLETLSNILQNGVDIK